MWLNVSICVVESNSNLHRRHRILTFGTFLKWRKKDIFPGNGLSLVRFLPKKLVVGLAILQKLGETPLFLNVLKRKNKTWASLQQISSAQSF